MKRNGHYEAERAQNTEVLRDRDTILLREEIAAETARLLSVGEKRLAAEKKNKIDAETRINQLLGDRPSRTLERETADKIASKFNRDSPDRSQTSASSKKGGKAGTNDVPPSEASSQLDRQQGSPHNSPPLSPSPDAKSDSDNSPRPKSGAKSKMAAKKGAAKKGSPKPNIDLKAMAAVFSQAAAREKGVVSSVSLMKEVNEYLQKKDVSHSGNVSYAEVTSLIRDVWKIPLKDMSPVQIVALCGALDQELSKSVALINLVEFATGEKVPEIDYSKPGTSDHSMSDDASSESSDEQEFILRVAGINFEDAPLPPLAQVTRSYLSSNPNLIIKGIKSRDMNFCLHVLDRVGHRGMNQTDVRGCTTLHVAAEDNLGVVCKALLDRASFAGPCAQDYVGWNALHRGARAGAVDSCRALMLHPRFTWCNKSSPDDGWNALHLAAMHNQHAICSLLAYDPRFTAFCAKDAWGRTPLHAASEHGSEKALAALLATERYTTAMVSEKDKWNRSALHTAKGGETGAIAEVFRQMLPELEAAENMELQGDQREADGQLRPTRLQTATTEASPSKARLQSPVANKLAPMAKTASTKKPAGPAGK